MPGLPEGTTACQIDSLENIYAYAERAYVRLQAGDVFMRCMEEASVSPMHQMVEFLVLAGPESLDVLREILQRRTLGNHSEMMIFSKY